VYLARARRGEPSRRVDADNSTGVPKGKAGRLDKVVSAVVGNLDDDLDIAADHVEEPESNRHTPVDRGVAGGCTDVDELDRRGRRLRATNTGDRGESDDRACGEVPATREQQRAAGGEAGDDSSSMLADAHLDSGDRRLPGHAVTSAPSSFMLVNGVGFLR